MNSGAEESEPSGPVGPVSVVAEPPAAPSDLGVVSSTTTLVSLSWVDQSDNEDGFVIERKLEGGVYELVADLPSGTTQFDDSGVSFGQTYVYRVYAYNGEGDSGYSNEAMVTAIDAATVVVDDFNPDITYTGAWSGKDDVTDRYRDTTHESISIGAELSFSFTGTSVSLIGERQPWGDVAEVYVDTVYVGDADFIAPGTMYQQVVFDIHSLSYGEHTVMLRVVDDAGWSYLDSITYITDDGLLRPASPVDLAALAISTSEIDVSWVDSSDNETGFILERAVEGGDYVHIASLPVGATSYPDSGLDSGETYLYRVYATGANGSSDYSVKASATTEGIIEVTIDDVDTSIIYSGDWTAQSSFPDRLNETTHETIGIGRSATFTFTGERVKLIAERQPWGGTAEIYLDASYVGLVDFNAPGTMYQQIVFDSGLLAYGEHTLVLQTINDSDYVYVDGFIVAM